MTSAINRFTELEVRRSAEQVACRPQAERVGFAAPARASIRTPSAARSSVDCRTKDRQPCISPFPRDTGLVNGSANRYALSARSSPYSHTTRCKYDGAITKIAVASAHKVRESLLGPMCARVNAPLSKHPFRSIIDPLSHLYSSREGRSLIAQMAIEVAGQNRAAAVRVADEQREVLTHYQFETSSRRLFS